MNIQYVPPNVFHSYIDDGYHMSLMVIILRILVSIIVNMIPKSCVKFFHLFYSLNREIVLQISVCESNPIFCFLLVKKTWRVNKVREYNLNIMHVCTK